jgi:oligoribonuclease NrnB/cAMP/cGMP phosphodiesterase (DHH superfamily)
MNDLDNINRTINNAVTNAFHSEDYSFDLESYLTTNKVTLSVLKQIKKSSIMIAINDQIDELEIYLNNRTFKNTYSWMSRDRVITLISYLKSFIEGVEYYERSRKRSKPKKQTATANK